MTIYNVVFKFQDGMTYNLNLHNKLNFIIGDSATGKTTLFNIKKENPITEVTLNGDDIFDNFITYRDELVAGVKAVLSSDAKLIIFDELDKIIDILKSYNISKVIKNKIVIIISRDIKLLSSISVRGITTGTQNFYTIKPINKDHISIPYFKFDKPKSYSRVFTEDSKSGKIFMDMICSNDNVMSLHGKESISLDLSNKDSLLLVDLCGLCQMLYNVWFLYKQQGIGVVDCYSFEWVILNTNKFKNLVDLNLDEYPEKKKNLERYITELLQKYSLDEYNKNYAKGDEEYFNWLFDCGTVDLLKETKYDYLVTAYKEPKEESKADRAKRLANLLLEE